MLAGRAGWWGTVFRMDQPALAGFIGWFMVIFEVDQSALARHAGWWATVFVVDQPMLAGFIGWSMVFFGLDQPALAACPESSQHKTKNAAANDLRQHLWLMQFNGQQLRQLV